MARARTALDASSGWTCTFRFPTFAANNSGGASMPVGGSLSALGGVVTVAKVSEFTGNSGAEYTAANVTGDEEADVLSAINAWDGDNPTGHITAGAVIAATAHFGMAGGERELWVIGTWQEVVTTPYFHFVYHYNGTAEVVVAASVSMTNIHRDEAVTAAALTSRNPLDFTDYGRLGAWVADEDSVMTVSANSASHSGAFPFPGDMDLGNTDFRAGVAFSPVALPTGNAVWGRIEDLAFFGRNVSLAGLDLHKPGASGTDPGGDGWCRTSSAADCARVVADGSDMTYYHAGSYTTVQGWSGSVSALTTCNFKELPTDWYAPNATVTGPVIEWYLSGSTYLSRKREWAGSLTVSQQYSSWLWAWERQCFDALDGCSIIATSAWRTAQGEDVGGSTPSTNDAQCGVLCHPISTATRVGATPPFWGPMIDFAHFGELNLDVPPGLASRPTPWVSPDAAKVVVSGDTWTVQAGALSPVVERTLVTLRKTRLNHLAAHVATPDYQNPEWPKQTKANLPNAITLDDPAWRTACPAEDITDLTTYKYLRARLTAPKAGTCSLYADYDVTNPDDPCYTCFEYRYGAEGEFTVTWTTHGLRMDFPVAAGANDLMLSMCPDSEGAIPIGATRLDLLTDWQFILPDGGASNEAWTFVGLSAIPDRGEGARSAPANHGLWRFKRSWDWMSNWSGFMGIFDGQLALEVDDGTGDTRHEVYSHKYIQKVEHCPTSEATGLLHYAKSLETLQGELNCREGIATGTYPQPEAQGYNEDTDGNRLKATFNWWDLRHAQEWGDAEEPEGCVCVGNFDIVQGIEQDVWYYAIPRGKIQGLLLDANNLRVRSGGRVVVNGRATGTTPWSYEGEATTDDQGRWKSIPLKEDDREYQVQGSATVYTVANREYTTLGALVFRQRLDPFITTGKLGDVWRVAEWGGVVYADRSGATFGFEDATAPFGTTTGYSRPSCAIMPDGSVIVAATRGGTMERARTRDHGETWEVC